MNWIQRQEKKIFVSLILRTYIIFVASCDLFHKTQTQPAYVKCKVENLQNVSAGLRMQKALLEALVYYAHYTGLSTQAEVSLRCHWLL